MRDAGELEQLAEQARERLGAWLGSRPEELRELHSLLEYTDTLKARVHRLHERCEYLEGYTKGLEVGMAELTLKVLGR